MLPHVIVHNSVSADGRTAGFDPDIGLHYELAGRWAVDAHLAGSETILAAEMPEQPEVTAEPPPRPQPGDTRPLLVVVDSRGRVRTWHTLLGQPYWRGGVALCSRTTPAEDFRYLEQWNVDAVVAGEGQVDLQAALEKLNGRYGVRTVLVDSGGVLNGVLLRAGLVSEVSLLVHPVLAGGASPRTAFCDPDPATHGAPVGLKLLQVEEQRDGIVWLRYQVRR